MPLWITLLGAIAVIVQLHCKIIYQNMWPCKTFENVISLHWKDLQLFLYLSHCGAYSTWPMDRSVYICWAAKGNGRLRGLGRFLSLRRHQGENNSNNKTGSNINKQNKFCGPICVLNKNTLGLIVTNYLKTIIQIILSDKQTKASGKWQKTVI